MQAMYEKMGGTYSLGEDGIYYPDLEVTEEIGPHYGKYGMMRKAFIKKHRRGFYTNLLLTGKLVFHLNEIDDCANERMETLIRQMKEQGHVDEELKALDQLGWVGAMNNIRNAAEEIVLSELIYS